MSRRFHGTSDDYRHHHPLTDLKMLGRDKPHPPQLFCTTSCMTATTRRRVGKHAPIRRTTPWRQAELYHFLLGLRQGAHLLTMVRSDEESTEDFPRWWEQGNLKMLLASARPAIHCKLSHGCQRGCLEETRHLHAAFSSLARKQAQRSSLVQSRMLLLMSPLLPSPAWLSSAFPLGDCKPHPELTMATL